MVPARHHLLRQGAEREFLEVADLMVVKNLLHGHECEGGDGEDDLHTLHAELVRTRRYLAPVRCRTTAQPTDLRDHGQIQQCRGTSEADHGNAECICMKAVHHGAGPGAQDE